MWCEMDHERIVPPAQRAMGVILTAPAQLPDLDPPHVDDSVLRRELRA